jgi:SAM-dependent methyltransferase
VKPETTNVDWDHRYRLGDTPWEKGYAAPPLSEWLEKHGPLNGRVLVPGCGSGHDVRGLAEAGSSNCTVVGLDIASAAIEQARRKNSLANAEFVKVICSLCLKAGGGLSIGCSSTPAFVRCPAKNGVPTWRPFLIY